MLHLIIMLGETNGQYNEHCLPLMGERDISIVTYFVPKLTPPPEITLFAGDGTLRGFFRALKVALRAKYDIIHAHAPQTGTLLVLATLAWDASPACVPRSSTPCRTPSTTTSSGTSS